MATGFFDLQAPGITDIKQDIGNLIGISQPVYLIDKDYSPVRLGMFRNRPWGLNIGYLARSILPATVPTFAECDISRKGMSISSVPSAIISSRDICRCSGQCGFSGSQL